MNLIPGGFAGGLSSDGDPNHQLLKEIMNNMMIMEEKQNVDFGGRMNIIRGRGSKRVCKNLMTRNQYFTQMMREEFC